MLVKWWGRAWMKLSGHGAMGRLAMRIAALPAPPHKSRVYLAGRSPKGYIAWSATVHHRDLHLGKEVFIDDRVLIYQQAQGGPMWIGDNTLIFRDNTLETGFGGSITIGKRVSIHPRCQINAYGADISIADDVMIAPGCALYPYNHGLAPNLPIKYQRLSSKGPIVIEEGAWLGFGCVVLSGVRIGKGAAVGAGSVVTRDIPDNAIANGVPARVVSHRSDLPACDLPPGWEKRRPAG